MHSTKKLSNDEISNGLGDRLYYSSSVVALNLKITLILSLGKKLILGLCLELSIKDPSVEKMGFIANG